VATDNDYSTGEDTQLTGNVLTGDTDADGDTLTATMVSGPAHGTLNLSADGSFTYTPAVNYNGTDTFTYTAGDGTLSDSALVTISVTSVNDAPVAAGNSFSTNEDTQLTGNVLTNDSDVDADSLTASLVTGPSHGTLNLNTDAPSLTPPPPTTTVRTRSPTPRATAP